MKPKTRLKKLLDGKYSPKKNAGFAFELNVSNAVMVKLNNLGFLCSELY
jgi:hypothetical protein